MDSLTDGLITVQPAALSDRMPVVYRDRVMLPFLTVIGQTCVHGYAAAAC